MAKITVKFYLNKKLKPGIDPLTGLKGYPLYIEVIYKRKRVQFKPKKNAIGIYYPKDTDTPVLYFTEEQFEKHKNSKEYTLYYFTRTHQKIIKQIISEILKDYFDKDSFAMNPLPSFYEYLLKPFSLYLNDINKQALENYLKTNFPELAALIDWNEFSYHGFKGKFFDSFNLLRKLTSYNSAYNLNWEDFVLPAPYNIYNFHQAYSLSLLKSRDSMTLDITVYEALFDYDKDFILNFAKDNLDSEAFPANVVDDYIFFLNRHREKVKEWIYKYSIAESKDEEIQEKKKNK